MGNQTYTQWKRSMVRAAKETKTPIVGHYELTACCNLDCKMCFVHNADTNALRARELSTETWKRIFDEAYDLGLLFATLSGGECLMRPDFEELYLHLWKKRVRVGILTNGTLISDEHVEFFKKYPPDFVRISLYGRSEEGYLKVTGHKGFEKAVSAIRKLRDAKIRVTVVVTPSRYMKEEYINIRRFCIDNGFPCQSNSFQLLKNREHPEKDDYFLSMREIVDLSIAQHELLKGPAVPVEFPPEPQGNCTVAPKGLTCSAGASAAVVSWDGRMYPCAMLPTGNISLLEMSYAEAWEKTKHSVSEMLLGMECVDCPYDKICSKCPAIRLTGLHTGHCDPNVCEVTKKLVAAGVKKLDDPAKNECNE
jgi:radical SAM protein with 4Fe4S-binding SPASM domain